MNSQRLGHQTAAALAAMIICISVASAQRKSREVSTTGREVTILVTAHPHKERAREAVAKLQPEDFTVLEDKRPQRIISVKQPAEVPPIISVLIQDDLVPRVGNEIKGIKEFIRRLPEGSRVLTGYLTAGSLR